MGRKSGNGLPAERADGNFSYAVFLSGGVSPRHVTLPIHHVGCVGEHRDTLGTCLIAGQVQTSMDHGTTAAQPGCGPPRERYPRPGASRCLGCRPPNDTGSSAEGTLDPLALAALTGMSRAAPQPEARPNRAPGVRRAALRCWPLLVVLAVQAALSLRLVWSNTAFQDEALYLRAGHLEWARWLHGAPIPDFPSYFSGAPVIYPPIGALADSIGGLAAARIAVAVLHARRSRACCGPRPSRLYGQRAARPGGRPCSPLWPAPSSWARCATYDALALFLLALAAWLGVRSADCQIWPRTALLITAGLTLAAADAVKYATALFTPVVVVVVALAVWRRARGRRGRWRRRWRRSAPGSRLVAAAVVVGGRDYWRGITTSTLARAQSAVPVSTVLQRAYIWTGLILLLAVLGAVLASRSEDARETPARRPGRRRPDRPGRASLAAHHRQPAEARGVRRLVRRDRGRLRNGAPEPGRPRPRVGRGHGPAHRRIDAVRVDGAGGRHV